MDNFRSGSMHFAAVIGRHSAARRWSCSVAALALVALSACVSVTYQRSGQHITPRAGETLVFGRLRFFYDGREFFPWEARLVPTAVGPNAERHLWLLRLGRRAVSSEVHPDTDGSLAVWLAPADYALLGSTQAMTTGTAAFEVVALLRVPAGTVAAYAGELTMRTESHEGAHLSYGFGAKAVEVQPIEIARITLEQKFGTLPEAPIASPWCAGDGLPRFDDPELANRAKDLLDRGCTAAR